MKFNPYEMPCKDCLFRQVGCHAECEQYKAASKKVNDYHAAQLKSYEIANSLNHVNNDVFIKWRLNHNRR